MTATATILGVYCVYCVHAATGTRLASSPVEGSAYYVTYRVD